MATGGRCERVGYGCGEESPQALMVKRAGSKPADWTLMVPVS